MPDAYSYVFDGQWGYLDQALGSASLVAQVTGVADYHIDADEPSVLDYLEDFKSAGQLVSLYAPDQFRISDHDPVMVGLTPNAPPTVDAGGPYSVNEGGSVTLTATGSDPNGDSLTYAWDLDNNGSFETPGQSVTFSAPPNSAPATHTVNVQVTDNGGLTGVDSAPVNVIFSWTGFFSPVDNWPAWNPVKAGSAIPVKFSLGGEKGLNIFAAGYPQSVQIDCDTGAVLGIPEPTANPGGSSLTYSNSGQYNYVWKTEKAWAGTCRQLTVELIDGTTHSANFKFK